MGRISWLFYFFLDMQILFRFVLNKNKGRIYMQSLLLLAHFKNDIRRFRYKKQAKLVESGVWFSVNLVIKFKQNKLDVYRSGTSQK